MVNIKGGSTLLLNSSELEFHIAENDAPVRFMSSQILCLESETCKITVLRGIGLDGFRIGSIQDEVRLSYRTINGTAKPGIDYVEIVDYLFFEKGATEKHINIEILADDTPEFSEYFSVILVHVTAGVILNENNKADIVISKNDDPHGVVSFENPSVMQSYIFREDEKTNYSISVIRSKGLLGNISVSWNLRPMGPEDNSIFYQSSGILHFKSGIANMNITLRLYDDNTPSEARKYRLSITKVLGGARIWPSGSYGDGSVEILVADSDNAYGIVEFNTEKAEFIMVNIDINFFLHILVINHYHSL